MINVVFGPTHPNLVEILSSLGKLLVKQKRYQEAKIYFEETKDVQHENSNLSAIVEKCLAKCFKNLESAVIHNLIIKEY